MTHKLQLHFRNLSHVLSLLRFIYRYVKEYLRYINTNDVPLVYRLILEIETTTLLLSEEK